MVMTNDGIDVLKCFSHATVVAFVIKCEKKNKSQVYYSINATA